MKSIRLITGTIVAVGLFAVWAPAAPAVTHTVSPGESIQDAVDAAAAGDTIKVEVGDYYGTPAGTGSAAVRITKPLKLIAKSKISNDERVRILPGAGNSHGIVVEPANPGDPDVVGVIIKGFTIEGFDKMGIWLRHVQKFKIQGNESINNLENGIFPTLSANGQVKKNVSYGSEDSALWVEASTNVRVIKNELYNSPTGLEVTVSKDIKIKKNIIHDNTVGIGLYHPSAASLPPLAEMGNWQVLKNHVYDNNFNNSAPSGSMAAELPKGGGILVLGVDDVIVKKNLVENNGFFGVGVIDWCAAVDGSAFDCDTNPPDVEPAPDDISVTQNTLNTNGTVMQSNGLYELLRADMVLLNPDGTNNCFSDNLPLTATSTFASPNQCM
jgi:parallel beta-helix repeat protein